jgi:RimJ/RimL family protein N-acetyltransferase
VFLLVAEGRCDGAWVPLAQVRLDINGEIGLLIDSDYRGRKLATPIILASIEFADDKVPFDRVVAKIRVDNIASIRAFEKAGFEVTRELICKGHACAEYEYKLSRSPVNRLS